MEGRIAASRLVFIDETWVKTNMAPLRGWGIKGRRLRAYAPYLDLHRRAALRPDRRALGDRRADQRRNLPPLHREDSRPTLSLAGVVVLDNLGSHKGKAARAIRQSQRRSPHLPAALQPRPQSHRTGLRQAKTSRPKSSAA